MMNKIQKLWKYIFRNDPSLQKIPLHIVRKSVTVDRKIQKILLNRFLSNGE